MIDLASDGKEERPRMFVRQGHTAACRKGGAATMTKDGTAIAATSRCLNMLRIMSNYVNLDAAVTLFVANWLTIPNCESVPQKQLDEEPEQMLIHLLGRDLRSYCPRPDDLKAIQHLHLDLRSDRLHVSSLRERREKVHAIYVKGDDMLQPHPLASRENLRNMTVDQALGKDLGKSAFAWPLILVGDDISAEDMSQVRRFFDCSRSGTLVKDMLDYIDLAADEPRPSPLPFVDLFPTTNMKNVDAQIKVLAKVLTALEHPIVATIGLVPAQAAKSNFRGRDSMNRAMYKDAMDADPFISNLDTNKTAPCDDNAEDINCIVLPMIHPGHVSYGPGTPIEMRLLMLQLARALLLSDCANKAAREPDVAPKMSRRFCDCVMQFWRNAESKSDLGARIHEAADDYRREVNANGQGK